MDPTPPTAALLLVSELSTHSSANDLESELSLPPPPSDTEDTVCTLDVADFAPPPPLTSSTDNQTLFPTRRADQQAEKADSNQPRVKTSNEHVNVRSFKLNKVIFLKITNFFTKMDG